MIKFNADTHTYYKEIPSVSRILREELFSEKYSGIPKHILERAAEWGTMLHEAIAAENPIMLDDLALTKYNEWLEIKEKYNITIINAEQMVDYNERYAGTYDLLCDMSGATILISIKTVAKDDKEYNSYQESYYWMAAESKGTLKIDSAWCLWLPKRQKAKFYKLERKPNELLLLTLENYERKQENAN